MNDSNLNQPNSVTNSAPTQETTSQEQTQTNEPPVLETPKRSRPRRFEQIFIKMEKGIELSLADTLMQGYMGNYGYTLENIQTGKALLDQTEQKHEEQQNKYADQYAASEILNSTWKDAAKTYMHVIQTARLAFKDDPIMFNRLGLNKSRRNDFGGWKTQANVFYNNLLNNPDAVTELAKFNLTQAELEAGKQLILDTVAASVAQQDAIAEAQKSTEQKNKIYNELRTWYTEYLTIGKIALKNDKQMMEKLGQATPAAF